jgi:hypothetical protein
MGWRPFASLQTRSFTNVVSNTRRPQ